MLTTPSHRDKSIPLSPWPLLNQKKSNLWVLRINRPDGEEGDGGLFCREACESPVVHGKCFFPLEGCTVVEMKGPSLKLDALSMSRCGERIAFLWLLVLWYAPRICIVYHGGSFSHSMFLRWSHISWFLSFFYLFIIFQTSLWSLIHCYTHFILFIILLSHSSLIQLRPCTSADIVFVVVVVVMFLSSFLFFLKETFLHRDSWVPYSLDVFQNPSYLCLDGGH